VAKVQLDQLRVVAYRRVSTDEQADSRAGLDAQEAAIEAEVTRRGWQLVAMETDAGASGKSMTGRPGLAAALTAVESGVADALVVAKLDRLSRSLLDFTSLMQRSNRRGWALVAIDLGVDTTTPSGKLVAHLMASVAEWERDVIGQRTKDALAARRAKGVKLGRPRRVSPEVVARMGAARRSGSSYAAIADGLNAAGAPTAQGGTRWYASTVRAVLATVES
jgi:DNA invertase Pin-like site-specific DNA recombinase